MAFAAVAVFLLFFMLFVLRLCGLVSSWLIFNDCSEVKIGLRTFRSMYSLFPHKWEVRHGCDRPTSMRYEIVPPQQKRSILVGLSFPAYLYLLYTEKCKKDETERAKTILVLEDMQKDIDRLKSRADREVQNAYEEQRRILKSWKGEDFTQS